MKNKNKKEVQKEYAKKNIEYFIRLLKTRFKPYFDKNYIKEIKDLSRSFNIRLTREQKLNFCNKCNISWNVKTTKIRLNSKNRTKEYLCKNCGHTRRFKYK